MRTNKRTDSPATDATEPRKLPAPLTIAADKLEAVAGGTLPSLKIGPSPVNGLVYEPM
jgi:hypothetical protein